MAKITKRELMDSLKNFLNNKIVIQEQGSVNFEIVLESFKYEVVEDILYLKDLLSNNKIEINLNIINYIERTSNTIICFLDDDMDTVLKIKEKQSSFITGIIKANLMCFLILHLIH